MTNDQPPISAQEVGFALMLLALTATALVAFWGCRI